MTSPEEALERTLGPLASVSGGTIAVRDAALLASGRMDDLARELLADRAAIPICDQKLAEIDGRSGLVATQAA